MAMVPSTGTPNNDNQGTTAQNYFMQLLQESQQINVFINDWTLKNAAEAEAETKYRILMDAIYTEASMSRGPSCGRRACEAVSLRQTRYTRLDIPTQLGDDDIQS